ERLAHAAAHQVQVVGAPLLLCVVRREVVQEDVGAQGGQPAGRGVTDTGPPADPGDQGHPSAQRGRIAGEFNVGHVPDAGGPSGAGQTLFPRAPGPSRLRGGALLAAAAEVPSHAACPIVLRAARFPVLRPPARLSAGPWPTPRPPTGPAPPSRGPAPRTR